MEITAERDQPQPASQPASLPHSIKQPPSLNQIHQAACDSHLTALGSITMIAGFALGGDAPLSEVSERWWPIIRILLVRLPSASVERLSGNRLKLETGRLRYLTRQNGWRRTVKSD